MIDPTGYRLRLKYGTTCRGCGRRLERGSVAFRFRVSRRIFCPSCHAATFTEEGE